MAGDTNPVSELGEGARAPSGRFVLRLPPQIHGKLRREAETEGVSLNEICVRRLSLGPPPLPPELAQLVERALVQFEDDLLGVILYGSWARNEAVSGSDVDVLVVLSPQVPIRRELYEEWEGNEFCIDGRPIDVHFAQLPSAPAGPSGLWAEVAIDGLVLFDRELSVSRYLVGVRRLVAEGKLTRRSVHGQPYWVLDD